MLSFKIRFGGAKNLTIHSWSQLQFAGVIARSWIGQCFHSFFNSERSEHDFAASNITIGNRTSLPHQIMVLFPLQDMYRHVTIRKSEARLRITCTFHTMSRIRDITMLHVFLRPRTIALFFREEVPFHSVPVPSHIWCWSGTSDYAHSYSAEQGQTNY